MGTNFYIEGKDGVQDYSSHLGKRGYSEVGLRRKKFIYYISRNYILNILYNLINSDSTTFIIDEYGNRMSIKEFLEEIYDLPYEERNYVFD